MFKIDDFIGNEQIIENIKNSNFNNQISHAYILNGNRGLGKTFLAKSFTKLILCEKNKTNACEECSSCKSFDSNNNPDVIYLINNKTIGIDNIRDVILKNIETKPFKYKYKVFIIKNADLMTIQAQNAILKTIEEPPSFAVFLFLTINYKRLLPTVLSRCVLFKIKPLNIKKLEQYLKNQNQLKIDEQKIKFISSYSEGNIGKALKIAESYDFNEIRQASITILETLNEKDIIKIYKDIKILENFKENIEDILEIFILTYRDVIVFKQTNNFDNIIQKDCFNKIQKISSNISLKKAIKSLDAIVMAKKQLFRNANFNMVMECLFFKLKERE